MLASQIKISDDEFLDIEMISSIHSSKRETRKVINDEFGNRVALITGEESVLTIRTRNGESRTLYGKDADTIVSEIRRLEDTPDHLRIQLRYYVPQESA
jgi:hypothetical protein